jgi:hypothetical protein
MTMRFIEHALELVLLGPSNHLMRAIREVSP